MNWRTCALLALAIIILAFGVRTAAQDADRARARAATLAEADRLYGEKSYAAALEVYERLLQAGSVPEDRQDEIRYRVGVCLGKSEQWDRALEYGLEFVKNRRGTVWEPRGLYWLGRLYLGVPHNGWRVGPKVHRGNDVPKTDAAEKPEQVYLAEQDRQNAQDALEAARALYPRYRNQDGFYAILAAEEIQLNFDLARVLQQSPDVHLWASKQDWAPPSDPQWKIDTEAAYSPDWAPPKKLLYLYEQIGALARTLPNANAGGDARAPRAPNRQAALGLFGKATWLRGYHQLMQQYGFRWDFMEGQQPKQVRLPYPYEDLKPPAVLRQLVREHPEDPVRDQAQYTIGLFTLQDGQPAAAEKEFRRFLEERPQSKWAEDARFHLAEITRRGVTVAALGTQAPGKAPKVNVGYRNVKSIRFELFRVRLEDVLGRADKLNDPRVQFNQFQQNFGTLEQARRLYGPMVARWDWTTKDNGDRQRRSETIELPVKEAGAYVIEASAPGLRTANVVLVSDLAVVQKTHRDGALLWVTNSLTGAPAAAAEVIAKQWWHEGGHERSSAFRGRTNAEGALTVPLQRGPGRTNFRIAALAYRPGRYAMTDPTWSQDYTDNPELFKVYSVTDRSVYRPLQTVHYRQMVMRRVRGELKPVAGQQVRVEVRDPNGQVVHQKSETTSEFGSINGQLSLSDSAPLGEYHTLVSIPTEANAHHGVGGNRFRVEEYKKPEFEVEVTPEAERVRLGQPTSVKVRAGYYFGGAVPGAKVTYRVYRTPWAQQYRFPRPFDFLHRYWNEGDYSFDHRNGEVVAQGDTQTDEKGEARISFPTRQQGSRWGNGDLSYTVEADVQDSSRRTISGTGTVKATKHDVAVFLDYPRGYATKGDRLDVEVMTLNPSDQPVSVEGTARVFRLSDAPKRPETEVHEQRLKTDAHGRGYVKWTAPTGGRYRVEFNTRDTAEQAVKGSLLVWVAGPELERGRFLFRNVEMRVQNLYYEEGQSAKVLLVTPESGCTVLLTREANNEILSKQVLPVKGRSLEVTLPLSRADVPNVHLQAVLLRDGQAFQATQELFVPPVRQFSTVTVQADREQYQPGEKARLRLHAKDWQGRPLRTELSVSVTDASLGYIQKDYAPDIRVYFHGDRRSMSIQQAHSIGSYYYPALEDGQPREQFKTHEWLMPEGMGQLPDWPGERSQGLVNLGLHDWYYFGGFRDRGRMMGGMAGFGGGALGPVSGIEAATANPFAANADLRQTLDRIPRVTGAVNLAFKGKSRGRTNGDPYGLTDEEAGLAGATVRSNFADRAFWTPAVVTDAQGNATVDVTWPDNLTQWRAAAVGTTAAAQVGSGETRVRTKKDLLVRLQAPRFFVERDEVTVSANVHNYTPKVQRVKVKLDLTGSSAELVETPSPNAQRPTPNASSPPHHLTTSPPEAWIEVPKDGEKRLDWTLKIVHEGSLGLRVTAQSAETADAMEMSFPVLVHGVERQVAQGGVMRQERSAQLAIRLPGARKPGSSELVVQLNPSLGATLLDALPYLADYPYGCIEQTVSRFLPAVVVAKTLKNLGYDLQDLRRRAELLERQQREGDRARPGGKTEAHSPYSYPKGRPGSLRVRELAGGTRRWRSPVFDAQELKGMVTEGLVRIRQFQKEDGGWGWWPGDSSDPYMTAYVLYGLITARDAGYLVEGGMIERGITFLRGRFLEDDDFHRMAYEARVLAMDPGSRDAIRPLTTGRLWANRERLSAYSKALLATALHLVGDAEKAQTLLRNVETTAKIDEANGTASWTDPDRCWWRWYNNRVETNAALLQAYMVIQPGEKLPTLLAKWLVNNRRGNTWTSTRETAMAVYALADYVRVNKELAPEYRLTVDLGGRVKREYAVNRENALFFDNQFVVPDELLETGEQTLTLTKEGEGTLYYSAYTRYFSLEEPIRATANEISVRRRYFRLIPGTAAGQPLDRPLDEKRENPFLTGRYELLTAGGERTGYQDPDEGPRYERAELKPGEVVASGDLLEVELFLESRNDYEYLIFEDLKPAGCEPVELRSGGRAGGGLYSNMELRDQKVAFFVSFMPQGTRTLTYRLRAEIPGRFHVLPTNAYAMYAPDIRALSDETTLEVKDSD
jgi:uncharacterized protein YfaS (alpha-2-macroglobulin family)